MVLNVAYLFHNYSYKLILISTFVLFEYNQ